MHIGVGRSTDRKGWYQQMKEWWVAHKTARHDEKLDGLMLLQCIAG